MLQNVQNYAIKFKSIVFRNCDISQITIKEREDFYLVLRSSLKNALLIFFFAIPLQNFEIFHWLNLNKSVQKFNRVNLQLQYNFHNFQVEFKEFIIVNFIHGQKFQLSHPIIKKGLDCSVKKMLIQRFNYLQNIFGNTIIIFLDFVDL